VWPRLTSCRALNEQDDSVDHLKLIDALHEHGLNVRFLGQVYNHLKKPHLICLCSVEMASRILKRWIVEDHAAISKQLTGLSQYIQSVVRIFTSLRDEVVVQRLLMEGRDGWASWCSLFFSYRFSLFLILAGSERILLWDKSERAFDQKCVDGTAHRSGLRYVWNRGVKVSWARWMD
jgi:hypothetical protein